jgi:hypothetical protein
VVLHRSSYLGYLTSGFQRFATWPIQQNRPARGRERRTFSTQNWLPQPQVLLLHGASVFIRDQFGSMFPSIPRNFQDRRFMKILQFWISKTYHWAYRRGAFWISKNQPLDLKCRVWNDFTTTVITLSGRQDTWRYPKHPQTLKKDGAIVQIHMFMFHSFLSFLDHCLKMDPISSTSNSWNFTTVSNHGNNPYKSHTVIQSYSYHLQHLKQETYTKIRYLVT